MQLTNEPTIMGIDASLTSTGVAITTLEQKIVILHTIKTNADAPIQKRIHFVYKELEEIIDEHYVQLILCENNYTGGSKEVNWVIGIILLIAAKKGIAIKTYAPASIKKAVTGNGRASKKEIKPAIHKIYGELRTNEHVRDALGIIHCYFVKEKGVRII